MAAKCWTRSGSIRCWRTIPLVLLSSSKSELKRARSYGLPAECYLEKPGTFQGFVELVQAIEAFRRKAVKEKQP